MTAYTRTHGVGRCDNCGTPQLVADEDGEPDCMNCEQLRNYALEGADDG